MIKYLILTTLLIGVYQAECLKRGGRINGTLSSQVLQIADWTTSHIANFTGIRGNYTVQNITNIEMQITAGINYYITIM
jgi:hypothetical protein